METFADLTNALPPQEMTIKQSKSMKPYFKLPGVKAVPVINSIPPKIVLNGKNFTIYTENKKYHILNKNRKVYGKFVDSPEEQLSQLFSKTLFGELRYLKKIK
jgi:hypothetical protein